MRHESENVSIREVTFQVTLIWDMLGTLLLKVPATIVMLVYGFEPIFITTTAVALLLQILVSFGTCTREASWFCSIQRIAESYCHQLRNRLHFLKIDTMGGEITAFGFVEEIAIRANDEELLSSILQRPSLFDRINQDAERKASVFEREQLNAKRLNEKYGTRNMATEVLPLTLATTLVGLFVAGWTMEGGNKLENSDMQTAAYMQVVLASLCLLIKFIVMAKAFFAEAVIDFWRHQRLILFFLHHVGAMNDTGVGHWGCRLSTDVHEMAEMERMKVTLGGPQDLNAVFACYDFLVEYLRLRTTFHNGFVAFLITTNVR